jgi:2-polyprenyl-3-methyl-5-hydroxy-6-metoxy-1,4-benzoquinol methylase
LFIAPGEWTLWKCHECRAAYLDPRPTRGTIALAYRDYPLSKAPQQSDDGASAAPRAALDRMRRALRNGYMNARYGYSFAPAIGVGRMLLPLFPRRRESADWSCRHLRKRTALLDVGCSNGEMLVRMARAGWIVHGVEPDPVAAQVAQAAGVPVTVAPLEEAELEPGHFDAVTMSHVLEHLHDPSTALANCRRALAPGGHLWIATPNLESAGHELFGRDWLHLDPPRHLVLFTRDTLGRLLTQCGFLPVRWLTHRTAAFSFANSSAIAGHERPFADAEVPRRVRLRAWEADTISFVSSRRSEELVVLARRD